MKPKNRFKKKTMNKKEENHKEDLETTQKNPTETKK